MGSPSTAMRPVARRSFLALLLIASAGCGGSGGGGSGPRPAFTFRWFASVDAIRDGGTNPATVPGVQEGDELTAHVDYDPAHFGAGANVSGDGLDYAAPAGLLMNYAFTSGGRFTKEVSGVRAQDAGAFDQWTWRGGDFGGVLFAIPDPTDASFTLPLPAQFATVHTQFRATLAAFDTEMSGPSLEFPAANPADVRRIFFKVTGVEIVQN